jgi:hypothetical protein
MTAAEHEFVEHWSTLPEGSTVDFYRTSHQGTFLNQKGVEVFRATDQEVEGRLITGGPVTYTRDEGEIVRA